jgi:hypothetical protein
VRKRLEHSRKREKCMFKGWGDCVQNGVATLRCLPIVFKNVVSALLLFVGIVAAFLIIWAGIKFINSGGDAKQVGAARQIMTYAIIGVILVLSSFAIIYFIGFATKTNCITQFGFNCN